MGYFISVIIFVVIFNAAAAYIISKKWPKFYYYNNGNLRSVDVEHITVHGAATFAGVIWPIAIPAAIVIALLCGAIWLLWQLVLRILRKNNPYVDKSNRSN